MAFAIFCTADVPVEIINQILEEAAKDSGRQDFWLVPEDLEPVSRDLSKDPSDYFARDYHTVLPVPTSFVPGFIGKDLASLIEMIHKSTETTERYIDPQYFAVLDAQTIDDGTVLLCEYHKDGVDHEPLRDTNSDPDEWEKMLKVETVRASPRKSSETLGVMSVKMSMGEFQSLVGRDGILN